MIRTFLIFALALGTLSACRTIDPMSKARTDELLGIGASETVFETGPRLPWKVGQWARFKTRNKEDIGAIEYRITGEEDGAWWMEIETVDHYTTSKQKWLVSGFNPDDIESIKNMRLLRVIMYDQEGKELPMPPMVQGLVNGMLESMIFVVKEEGAEEVVVGAGRFAAVRDTTTLRTFGMTFHSEVWVSGRAPIWALVKSVASDGSNEMELIGFGE